jgi:sugar phosphate isomerase/epimerase
MPNPILGIGLTAPAGRPDCSDLAAILDDIETRNVSHIELSTYDNDLIVGGRIQRGNLQRLRTACGNRRVGFSVHGPLAINFFDEAFRLQRHFDVFKAAVEIAAEVGAVHYVLHTGQMRMQQHPAFEAAYERQREWLARCGDIGREHGIPICVENLFDELDGSTHTASPARLATELTAVNHPFVLATLDISHAYLHCCYRGLEFVTEVAALAPHAKHIHMHDSFGRADDIWMFAEGERVAFGHGDLHLPVGWGSIPWAELSAACQFPAQPLFNIELKPRYWYAVDECVEQTAKFASDACRS